MKLTDCLNGVGRSFPYFPAIEEWLGNRNAALLLCYLHNISIHTKDGWVFKTREEIWAETRLSVSEQRNARDLLVLNGILEQRFEFMKHRTYYRLAYARMSELWSSQASIQKPTKKEGGTPCVQKHSGSVSGSTCGVRLEARAVASGSNPLILEEIIRVKENVRNATDDLLTPPPEPAALQPSGASTGGEPKKRVRKEKAEPSERGLKFADWFKTLLPESTNLAASYRTQWALCFDELMRLDNRTDAEIAKVCQWARKDAFWQKNFLSPVKLRNRNGDGIQYFDVFTEAMKQKPKGAAAAMAEKKAGEFVAKPGHGPLIWDPTKDPMPILNFTKKP